MKTGFRNVVTVLIYFCSFLAVGEDAFDVTIPLAGNAWLRGDELSRKDIVGKNGISNWSDKRDEVVVYFRTDKIGTISLGLKAKGQGVLEVQLGEVKHSVTIKSDDFAVFPVGSFKIDKPGYQQVILRGFRKKKKFFPEVESLLLKSRGGEELCFAKEEFYWARRGPSVHLGYQVDKSWGDIEWMYNEITVPKSQDVIGSYFMANGFAQGYFGIQVNSKKERRVLFSVWSPFNTQNPKDIPKDQRIIPLKKGEGVHIGEFGNEGSGCQSFLRYMWKAQTTYRFLLKVHPSKGIKGSTDYTAYFYAPEVGKWKLIASFRRPKTDTFLKRPHSFLENFSPRMGQVGLMAIYGNQWLRGTDGKWHELTKARFTADATAHKKSRMDYAGGVSSDGKSFFMKNCGFFSPEVPFNQFFEREATDKTPEVDFERLLKEK